MCFTVMLSVISYTVLCCVALCRVVLHCVVGIEQCCDVLCGVVLFHLLCCVVLRW